MKQRRTRRGLYDRIEFLNDDGSRIDWGTLSEEDLSTIRSIGFHGLTDFLTKAEKLADEQLAANNLPTDWPRPARLSLLGTEVDGWYTPDGCEPPALKNSPPNAEFAAALKRDVHRCRELLKHAEFRSRTPVDANVVSLSAERRAGENMYFGVIVALSYWALLANVRYEKAVIEKETRRNSASALTDEDILNVEQQAGLMQKQKAAKLGITPKQFRTRLLRIRAKGKS